MYKLPLASILTLVLFSSCNKKIQNDNIELIYNDGKDSILCGVIKGELHGKYTHYKNGILIEEGQYVSISTVSNFDKSKLCIEAQSIPYGHWKFYDEVSGVLIEEGKYSTECWCEYRDKPLEDGWNLKTVQVICKKSNVWSGFRTR